MAASVLSVRVDSSIKDSFAELCEELGMTSSVAVNMFMLWPFRVVGIRRGGAQRNWEAG